MRRTREIVGLPVLDIKTGEQVGWVQDITFDTELDRVSGVLLEGGHFFHSMNGIPRQAVAFIGKDALTVNTVQLEEVQGTLWSQKIGNQVYTEDGEARGKIEDVFLDDSGERIVGYEVSDGFLADLFQGRGTILQQHVIVDGEDVLVVDDQARPWGENGGGSV
ncbi:MAG: PRC-barrel domain-containing protein [Desulfitobacteriaceae bacterium]|nr:PRC-barrel domain-containing protein [Desulfitobacteriaceae bacterium]MDI6878011.1 PRC-barrel domain-containing protein [Desulfitobacteriaceae bacterium]MDI6914182.1 PRC-barrel domain-containing protein [Desulfitobacteriaceae bacterium]